LPVTPRFVKALAVCATLAAVLCVLAAAPSARATTQETAFTITGRGWGHGIGMSQWGAYGFAKNGWKYQAILKHYYTGIDFATLGNPVVRIRLRSGVNAVKVTCPNEFTATDGSGSLTIPAGSTATTTYADGSYRVVAGDVAGDFAAAVTFRATSGTLRVLTDTDLNHTGPYRGTIRVERSGSSLMMINRVALESYLRGVVPIEVSPSWPAESLKAQACAARAYTHRSRTSSRSWDLYCDVRSQVYKGAAVEDARSDAAITATAGVVPTYNGAVISAFYSACSGGRTENIEFAWDTTAQPYLKGVKDPYDSYAPLHTWGPLRRTKAQVAGPLGDAVKGSLRAVYRVKRGTSGRTVTAAIIGSGGTTYMHGSTLRVKLGLNSTWATFKSMSINPAARDKVTIASGTRVTLKGRVYPALASGATVKLHYNSDGTWHSRTVATSRTTQSLPGGYTARYSTYRANVRPSATTKYYFSSGSAKTPVTTITVK
jgi:stage II sporulation protein D